MRNFGPNVVSFIITLGRKQWYVVGYYMPPNNLPTVYWITKPLACGPKGVGELILGELNAYLEDLRDQREEQLVTVLVVHLLTDQAQHFLTRRR